MDFGGNWNIEELKRRYERRMKRLKEENDDTSRYAIGYGYKVDGVIYPVCAYFPMGDFDEADEKIKYLISGEKKVKRKPKNFQKSAGLLTRFLVCCG